MKLLRSHFASAMLLCWALLLAISGPLRAQVGSQEITLVEGWNSVWLEVEPTYAEGDTAGATTLAAGDPLIGRPKAPGDIFPATVTTVISPRPLAGLAEYFSDDPTTAGSFNQDGWEQWHRPAGIDDNLSIVTRNRAYLIEASAAEVVTVTGRVSFHRPKWTPDRFNLIGFGIKGTISFSDFFGPAAGAHPVARIYKLDALGNWSVADSNS